MAVSPQSRKRAAAVLVAASSLAWPVTTLTVFADEPVGILGLSWFAIILTAADVYLTTDVRDSQEGDD